MEILFLLEVFVRRFEIAFNNEDKYENAKRLLLDVDFCNIISFEMKQEDLISKGIKKTNSKSIDDVFGQIRPVFRKKCLSKEFKFNGSVSVLFFVAFDKFLNCISTHPIKIVLQDNTNEKIEIGTAELLLKPEPFYHMKIHRKKISRISPVIIVKNLRLYDTPDNVNIGKLEFCVKITALGIQTSMHKNINGNECINPLIFKNDKNDSSKSAKESFDDKEPYSGRSHCGSSCCHSCSSSGRSCSSRDDSYRFPSSRKNDRLIKNLRKRYSDCFSERVHDVECCKPYSACSICKQYISLVTQMHDCKFNDCAICSSYSNANSHNDRSNKTWRKTCNENSSCIDPKRDEEIGETNTDSKDCKAKESDKCRKCCNDRSNESRHSTDEVTYVHTCLDRKLKNVDPKKIVMIDGTKCCKCGGIKLHDSLATSKHQKKHNKSNKSKFKSKSKVFKIGHKSIPCLNI